MSEKIEIYDAVVIGAGFSGIYMLYRLRDVLGMNATVVEGSDGIGGTWHHNRYPGARCDTEAYIYCFSFDDELLQDWEWSGRYPEQEELHRYLNHVVDRFDLRRDIQLQTRIVEATWNDETGRWDLLSEDGRHLRSNFIITGVGLLSVGHVPSLNGLDRFEGEWYHTASWPAEGVDFSGKRVGVIGTGSTGVQCVPVIAETAAHLTVFQRTPQYAVPAHHEKVDRAYLENVKKDYDTVLNIARWSAGGFPWEPSKVSALEVSSNERLETYEALWEEGGFRFLYGSYRDIFLDRRANDTASEFIRAKIRAVVKDPILAEQLLPVDHPFGARRPIVESGYFETFNRDNVALVDVRLFPIENVTPTGVQTTIEHHQIDVLVFATGFDAVTGPFMKMNIKGRDTVRLTDKWANGPETYLGLSVHGFPNFFMVTGPGSTFGNAPVVIEHHVEWIAALLQHMHSSDIDQVEATKTAEQSWGRHVDELGQKSLVALADSWFTGANIPGKPKAFFFYPGSFGGYRRMAEQCADDGYPGFESHGTELSSQPLPVKDIAQ